NKLTLQLLGQVMNLAEEEGILQERDFMELSEREVMTRLEEACGMGTAEIRSGSIINKREGKMSDRLYKLYKTFRTMTEIKHTESALPEDDWFCVNLKVKQRYINPLVISTGSGSAESADNRGIRLSEISEKAGRIIRDFLTYSDTPYGCVKLI
ncbi:MAG: hypothetical protein K5681_09765, partial [Treponema sp.]|nr:hypothetical protein [Treponema sp.]